MVFSHPGDVFSRAAEKQQQKQQQKKRLLGFRLSHKFCAMVLREKCYLTCHSVRGHMRPFACLCLLWIRPDFLVL